MNLKKTILSKSKYISGIQCLKYLWHIINEPDSIPPYDEPALFRFQQGHEVGELAKILYPDGLEVEHGIDIDSELEISRKLTGLAETGREDDFNRIEEYPEKKTEENRRTLFEPSFSFKNSFARPDILEPAESGSWNIIEVKSSTSIKDINIHDMAFQKYCYKGAGLKISRCFLMYINKDYRKEQEIINPEDFFILEDVTEKAEFLQSDIEKNIEIMLEVINKKTSPEIKISQNCYSPYECPLKKVCWAFLPERNVFELHRGKDLAFSLYDKGIIEISQINEACIQNPFQKIQYQATSQDSVFIDKENIVNFLNNLKYPLYFLDFETFATAIPKYIGVKPYQNIPFQYSCNRIKSAEDQYQENFYFLADNGGEDPREDFLKNLKKTLGYDLNPIDSNSSRKIEYPEGTILVYYENFEKSILRELACAFPEHSAWIEHAISRIIDLYEPFGRFYYYNSSQQGSASLKKVLPALTGIRYDDMGISNGREASLRYLDITFLKDKKDSSTKEYIEKIRKDLIDYCGLDTEGMIFILRELIRLADK